MKKKTGKLAWTSPKLEQIEMVDTSGNGKGGSAVETEMGAARTRS